MTQASKASSLSHLLCQNLFSLTIFQRRSPQDHLHGPNSPCPFDAISPLGYLDVKVPSSTPTAFPKYEFLIEGVVEGPQSISTQKTVVSLGHAGPSIQSSADEGVAGRGSSPNGGTEKVLLHPSLKAAQRLFHGDWLPDLSVVLKFQLNCHLLHFVYKFKHNSVCRIICIYELI